MNTTRSDYGCCRRGLCTLAAATLAWIGAVQAAAATVISFDDVEFWTGAGANRAAVVIDWNGDSGADQSLTWGYRWDGEAKGLDMLMAVVAADERLFAKFRPETALGIGVFGLGYDLNDDGQFALSDFTAFDENGVAFAEAADERVIAGSGDAYREGWSLGVWCYGIADANPWTTSWLRSPAGPSGRPLVDGAWDSWAFMRPIRPNAAVFAANAAPAETPGPDADADFDGDGIVDGADFLAWQRGLGTSSGVTHGLGNANGDLAVDSLDLAAWKSGFDSTTPGDAHSVSNRAVPEPRTIVHSISMAAMLFRCFSTRRRS